MVGCGRGVAQAVGRCCALDEENTGEEDVQGRGV